ncbi:hypothetical protein B0H14DRAFT_3662534 [Mycena olivaceomarginata]|nr:hypothetical protein B0H14DRAFT_3662534 [Mycena olivaceomarginata]
MSHATEYRNKPYANPPHHELLDAQREAKMRLLKRGDEFQLKLAIPPKNPDPLSRPVPLIPALSTTHFRLCDELQTGLGHLSQAWAYEHLKEKQGLCVPYFFGLHQITTPSKEWAWVLVLEHIHGKTLTAAARSKSWDDIYRACELGLNLVKETTGLGLLLHDIRGPNFILTGKQVVGIDFQPMTVIEPSYDLVHVANRLEVEFFHAILDHFSEEENNKMVTWAQEKLPTRKYIWERYTCNCGGHNQGHDFFSPLFFLSTLFLLVKGQWGMHIWGVTGFRSWKSFGPIRLHMCA